MFATLKRWLAAAPPDKNASGQSLDYWRTRAIAAELRAGDGERDGVKAP